MLNGSVLITGGTGTLGKAIVRRAAKESWPCTFTIYSRDEVKQQAMRRDFPKARYAIGDVYDYDTLSRIVSGHSLIIHAAAFKHIPAGELNVRSMLNTNLEGSRNVAKAAIYHNVSQVIGISTDKACHPVNAYGSSKMLMERIFQEYDSDKPQTRFHLARYGNVLASSGSIIVDWRRKLKEQGYINATDPNMSRFWLTIDQAIDVILLSLTEPPGTITVPKYGSTSLKRLEEYFLPPDTRVTYDGMRAGEKRHEELISVEESRFVEEFHSHFRIWPVWGQPKREDTFTYTSATAKEITREEFSRMIGE